MTLSCPIGRSPSCVLCVVRTSSMLCQERAPPEDLFPLQFNKYIASQLMFSILVLINHLNAALVKLMSGFKEFSWWLRGKTMMSLPDIVKKWTWTSVMMLTNMIISSTFARITYSQFHSESLGSGRDWQWNQLDLHLTLASGQQRPSSQHVSFTPPTCLEAIKIEVVEVGGANTWLGVWSNIRVQDGGTLILFRPLTLLGSAVVSLSIMPLSLAWSVWPIRTIINNVSMTHWE